MHHSTDRIIHTTAYVTSVVEHTLEHKIAHQIKRDQLDDTQHHVDR